MNHIVTVTCDRDFDMMLMQAQSIDKFLLDRSTHWVVIQTSSKPIQEWVDALSPYYTGPCQLRFFDTRSYKKTLSENLLTPGHKNWIDQQMLKLLIVDRIDSDSYLVLDTKNFFIKPTRLSESPQHEGNAFIDERQKQYRYWPDWIELLENITGKKPTHFWEPTTPFRMKTSIVKEILNNHPKLELLFDYVHNGLTIPAGISEFILYRFYSNFDFNTSVKSFSFTFWGNYTIEMFRSCLTDNNIKIIGFHRFFIRDQSDDCISEIQKSLIEIGFDNNIVNRVFDKKYWAINVNNHSKLNQPQH